MLQSHPYWKLKERPSHANRQGCESAPFPRPDVMNFLQPLSKTIFCGVSVGTTSVRVSAARTGGNGVPNGLFGFQVPAIRLKTSKSADRAGKMAASDKAKSPTKKSSLPLMALNDTKAGMGGLDKDRINAVIEEASRGSKFYAAKQKAQERISAQVEDMKRSLAKLSANEVRRAAEAADKAVSELRESRDLSRTIVHVDMDAFYAAVEMRDDPSLREVPMAVGGTGMLSTSNYLARRFGVRAGMPGFIGKKLCPELVLVPLNFKKYREVSAEVKEVFREYDPDFSPMSLDEAYLDITEYLRARPGMGAEETVKELRGKIEERTRLTASAGIAANTMLAKICSDFNKPNGQYYLRPEVEVIMEFMRELPIRKVSGIGNVTEQLLSAVGAKTCHDLYDKRGQLKLLFSDISFNFFLRISQGVGSVSLPDYSDRERKSISTETTFRDTDDFLKLAETCAVLSADLSEDLEKHSLKGKAVTLKIKTHRFKTKTKVTNLREYTNDANVIDAAAMTLLRHFAETAEEKPLKLRLMGVRMSDFQDQDSEVGGAQKKLDSFFKQKSPVKSAQTFGCPVCGKEVEAKTEFAFNQQHLDKCLEGSLEAEREESINIPGTSSAIKVEDPCSSDGDTRPSCSKHEDGISASGKNGSLAESLGKDTRGVERPGESNSKEDTAETATSSSSAGKARKNFFSSSGNRPGKTTELSFAASPSTSSPQTSDRTCAEGQSGRRWEERHDASREEKPAKEEVVCPVCSKRISEQSHAAINRHIDECLNVKEIEKSRVNESKAAAAAKRKTAKNSAKSSKKQKKSSSEDITKFLRRKS